MRADVRGGSAEGEVGVCGGECLMVWRIAVLCMRFLGLFGKLMR